MTMGVSARELSDDDLRRELAQLKEKAADIAEHGTSHQQANHRARTEELEAEFLRRFLPDSEQASEPAADQSDTPAAAGAGSTGAAGGADADGGSDADGRADAGGPTEASPAGPNQGPVPDQPEAGADDDQPDTASPSDAPSTSPTTSPSDAPTDDPARPANPA